MNGPVTRRATAVASVTALAIEGMAMFDDQNDTPEISNVARLTSQGEE